MVPAWCTSVAQGIRLTIQLTPNAKRTEVIGVTDDALKIRLQAPPIDGRANEALIRFVADRLGVAKSYVQLTHGHTSRKKMLLIANTSLSPDMVQRTLIQ